MKIANYVDIMETELFNHLLMATVLIYHLKLWLISNQRPFSEWQLKFSLKVKLLILKSQSSTEFRAVKGIKTEFMKETRKKMILGSNLI